MTVDADISERSPVVLTNCYDAIEASAVVAALEQAGITALTDGELVSFSHTELRNTPIVRVASCDLHRAQEVLDQWRDDVARRRSERLANQNSPHDPTTNDDVFQDYHGEDGVLWDRYGRPSPITQAVFVILIACGFGFCLLSWTSN